MIAVCELQCKEFSHEKVNSGFICGLRLAFPQERIRVYAHASHIVALKEILKHDGVDIDNIEYVPIRFGNAQSLMSMPAYFWLLKGILSEVASSGTRKVFFLSFSAKILFLVKLLHRCAVFSKFKFALVLHGEFESIVGDDETTTAALEPEAVPVSLRIRRVKLQDIPLKLARRMKREVVTRMAAGSSVLSTRLFPLKKMLLWRNSSNFRFVALAPYIVENARKYIDVDSLHIFSIILPTVFHHPLPPPANSYPKFAIFGYGNAGMLNKVLRALALREITQQYEIRIIGMNSRGIEGFSNVTMPIRDRGLTREEMEVMAVDIDAFLILYPEKRYRLSCSGSILESLSYMKPVLHFGNDCVDFFDTLSSPIGIRCNTVDEYADMLQSIIYNYAEFQTQSELYRKHILQLRTQYAIETSANVIRQSFTWSGN